MAQISDKVQAAIDAACLYRSPSRAALVRQMETQAGVPLDRLKHEALVLEAEVAAEILAGTA